MSDDVEVVEIWSRQSYRCQVCGDHVHRLRLVDGVVVRDESPHVHTAAEWATAYPWDDDPLAAEVPEPRSGLWARP